MAKSRQDKWFQQIGLTCLLLVSFGLIACGGDKTPSTSADPGMSEENQITGPNTLQSIDVQSEPLGTVITITGTQEMAPNQAPPLKTAQRAPAHFEQETVA